MSEAPHRRIFTNVPIDEVEDMRRFLLEEGAAGVTAVANTTWDKATVIAELPEGRDTFRTFGEAQAGD